MVCHKYMLLCPPELAYKRIKQTTQPTIIESTMNLLQTILPTFLYLTILPLCYGSGGELRKRVLNYCDTSLYEVRIEAFDWINNYERFTYFEFIDRVRGPVGDINKGAPLSYFDDSVINDANTVYLPHTYRSNNDDEPQVIVTRRSDNEQLRRVNLIDNGEAVYVVCEGDGDITIGEDTLSIVLDDDFSYRINDASCAGGIRVFGRSNRFYGV